MFLYTVREAGNDRLLKDFETQRKNIDHGYSHNERRK